MSRVPFIAGNWKMNLGPAKACELAKAVVAALGSLKGREVAVGPPFPSLAAVAEALKGSGIGLAGQNCHWEASGAFTGEVSAEMLREIGCSHVILGHSERRQHFGETDATVNRRVQAAFRAGLLPILCVGETLPERESGQTLPVVRRQLLGGLQGLDGDRVARITVAYEPVWAIGTGKVATPAQAQEVHAFLRGVLAEAFGPGAAGAVRIQYGGSVKPGNAKELMACEDIDGALVGGASLEADAFVGIVKASA